jgi:hypothetical protein
MMTLAEYEAGMAEIEQKLVRIAELRKQLQARRQEQAANLGLGGPLVTEKPAAEATAATGAAPMSALDTIDKFNPPGIGEYNQEQVAKETTGEVSQALASKPSEAAPAASTAVRVTEPSQVDVGSEMVPGNGPGLARTVGSAVDAVAGGVAEGLTMGLNELPERARKAMEEHPILATAGSFAGQALPIAGASGLANITVQGLKAAIPSLLKSEGGKELVDVILRRAAKEGVAGVYYSAMREGVSAVKGEERDLNDVLVGLATDVGLFAGGGAAIEAAGAAIGKLRGKAPVPESVAPEAVATEAAPLKAGSSTDVYKTELPVSEPEALKAVSPLDEAAAAKERAIAGEPALERGTNVLIEAEKAGPAEAKPVDRAEQAQELLDLESKIEEKRATGEDTEPEVQAIEKIGEELPAATPRESEAVGTAPTPAGEAPVETATPLSGTERATMRLAAMKDTAKIRIQNRLNKSGETLRSGLDPTVGVDAARNLTDLGIIGAATIAKGAIKFAEWSKVMIDELGEEIRPHLELVYEKAKEKFHSIRARYTVLEHGDYYKSISMPPEDRPRKWPKLSYDRIDEIAADIMERRKAAKPTGPGARKGVNDIAWKEMVKDLYEAGVPMQKVDGELVPLVPLGNKPAPALWKAYLETARKRFSEQQLSKPSVKKEILQEAREQFVLEMQANGVATYIRRGNQQRLPPKIRRNQDLTLRLITEQVLNDEEKARLSQLNRTNPDQALAEYESIAKQRGVVLPTIRQSGTYVPAEALLHETYKDAEAGMLGGTKETFRLLEEIDGALSAEAKAKLPGQGGPIAKGVLWRTHDMIRQKLSWLADNEAALKRIKGKLGRGDRMFANKVIELLERTDANLSTEELLKRSEIYDVFRKQYPSLVKRVEDLRAKVSNLPLPEQAAQIEALVTDELAKGQAGKILKYAQQMRQWYDDTFDAINYMRRMRSQKEIPYRQRYSTHELQQEVGWAKARNWLLRLGEETQPEIKTPAMPEFVQPNKPFNPRELPRNAGLEEFEREMDLGKLSERYLDLAANDIFNTSIIQNNKAYADFLGAMGYPNAGQAIHNWTAEVFGKTPNPLDRMVNFTVKIGGVKVNLLQALGFYKGALIRSSFPLNLSWIALLQTANVANTVGWHGVRNSAAGLMDWFAHPAFRREALEKAYSMMIKSERGGRISSQDFDKAMASAAQLERKPLEKATDAFNYFSEQVEKHMTGWAIATGYRDGMKKGLKGQALWEFASEAGERAQNLFNNEDVPGILRSRFVKGVAPFQTFTFGMFNTMRELIGRTGTPPATAAERMKIVLRFAATATAVNYISSGISGRKPWDASSFVPFYGNLIEPGFKALQGEESQGTRSLPSPAGTLTDLAKALNDAIAKGQYKRFRSWLVRYGTGLATIPGGTEMNRLWDGIEAVARGGVEDASGKMLFPVTGTTEQVRAIFGGPYGTAAGREYSAGMDKGLIKLPESTSDQKLRAIQAIPIVGEMVVKGREKKPAQVRTEMMKKIFEGVKDNETNDLESDMEKFMSAGGEWPRLKQSLNDRYATPEEIAQVKTVWDSRLKAFREAGLWDDIVKKRFQMNREERAAKKAEDHENKVERDKRRAIQVRRAG